MVTAALGWLGMAGTFGAYVLLVQGRVRAESLTYGLLNAGGGLLGGVASALYGAWPSATSNLIWAAMGAYGVVQALRPAPAAITLLPTPDEPTSVPLEAVA